MNPGINLIREMRPADELLNRAFELAYFILGDRPSSIYVAMAAMDKVKAAMSRQGRRLNYTPTGRSAYPAARTKVNLSELHLLQRLVYVESELFERLLEGQQKTVPQDDLIIRYIKHLVRITTKHNSFYVTLGLCRLLYNYSTAETSELYNLVLQDPERIRDDYYYRSRKKHLMQEISERFGILIRTQRGFRREERFQPQEDSQRYADLVRQCLMRFTPWRSECVLPKELEPQRNVITQLLFEGKDPDNEHEVELNRMHTLIHPECFERLIAALGLDPTSKRLELPSFFVSSGGSRPGEERFNPTELTEAELDAVKHYLDKNVIQRKKFSGGPLRLLIDGERQRDFELAHSNSVEFNLKAGSELIEIRSIGSVEAEQDALLAVSFLTHNQFGFVPAESLIPLDRKRKLALSVLPSTDPSGEPFGATLRIGYQQNPPSRAILKSPHHVGSWLNEWIRSLPSSRVRRLIPALGILLIALCAIGLWAYLRSGKGAGNQLARLQKDRAESPGSVPHSTTTVQTEPSIPPSVTRQPQTTLPAQPETSLSNQAARTERTRSTTRKPATAMLLAVKKVYVDPLGDDLFSQQLRERLTTTLRSSNRFEVVSNRDDADAVFRGSATLMLKQESNSTVVLELVNAGGQVVWSLSSGKAGRILSSNATSASASIWQVLVRDMQRKR